MDIYQIIIYHNRSWTIREIIAFAVVFLIAVFMAAILLKHHRIAVIQAIAGLSPDLSCNRIRLYCFYENSRYSTISVRAFLVMEGNSGNW